ncbi:MULTISPECIES: ShlB/FhaC/HecB family hemolysin secretion/activation protein [unclassified Dolichospermum]|uniref:ShlB/FhaC/HecB family hemolysin secretion/activation protein n=1 Tax=unclassified Dolichospermum TaxID=2622029 RepID=UPI0014489BDC|nr:MULTISPECIES: ShlB/FhaC/HecB family hemolysin secretion/activation protein [unclassified Dolichospermum]MTJ15843.1 ShlB/FhaC/HecB family hemolysin secretion/activation protein [Dolichospermum sp. UHCC 0299]MTJ41612.1 ShlB/FhaC/HecB family hemolysin secretion/activation protein [Dolichospermum sp. UHCC 0406]
MRWVIIPGSSLAILATFTLSVLAQSVPPGGVNLPSNTQDTIQQTLPNQSDSPPSRQLESSPSTTQPNLSIPPVTQPSEIVPSTQEPLPIKRLAVCGSTALADKIIDIVREVLDTQKTPVTTDKDNCLIFPIVNSNKPTLENLFQLRSKITQLYIKEEYITSGAFLRVQDSEDISHQIVKIQVVEGELEKPKPIKISGLNRLQEVYVRSRLELATETPLNQRRLKKALQLLQLDPLIEKIEAELIAGSRPGSNILDVKIKEAPAFHTVVSTANNQSPSIGSLETNLLVVHNNLLGFGDRFSGQYGFTEGLDNYDLNYTIPINARDGTLSLRYNNSNSHIIQDKFRDLGIRSETQTVSFSVRQPVFKAPESELALGVALDVRRSQSFLLNDIPFSFSIGPENGESKVAVIRFSQDWVDRGLKRILAARSQFSFGIDAFDATINNTGTDGRFFSWLGQFQWVQRLSPRTVLVARIDGQITPDSLLPLERFSIGGVNTVRGYAQNQLVADNGIISSLELRIPLTKNPNILELAPFFEIGRAWNNQNPDPSPATIASLGLGGRWQIGSGWDLRLDYGIPLIQVNKQGDSLQENGVSFLLRYQPF